MKKKGYLLLCLSLAVVFVISAAGATLAVWRKVGTSDHVVNTAAVTGQIIEQYEGAEEIYPGSTTEKVVNVQNTGTADCVVRIRVEKAWGTERDESGDLVADESLSTDNILISYNTGYWLYDKEDGYFYYKGVLKPGETTAAPLFEEFTIDGLATGPEYAGRTADIWVKMECVQAAFGGPSIWNKTAEELGIAYTEPEKPLLTASAEFRSPADGFVFFPVDETSYTVSVQDLFYNFKNLLPGETASQTITVTNSYSQETEIFLRAEDIEQSLSPEQKERVDRLLREYADIVITDDTGHVLYNGPIWGNLGAAGGRSATMKNEISLGRFAAGQTMNLNVQLQIDPEMSSEYAELFGLVRWVWSAEGAETTTTPPQTGDNSNIVLLGLVAAASAAGLLLVLFRGRKSRK